MVEIKKYKKIINKEFGFDSVYKIYIYNSL